MKYTVNLRVETHSGTSVEPYTVIAGNKRSAASIAAAEAIRKYGRNHITEISELSVEEVKSRESA